MGAAAAAAAAAAAGGGGEKFINEAGADGIAEAARE